MERDRFKRGILSLDEVHTLVEENPGRVVISAENEKDYDITVVAPAASNDARQPRTRESVSGQPTSGKNLNFVYRGKKKGELTKLINEIGEENEKLRAEEAEARRKKD